MPRLDDVEFLSDEGSPQPDDDLLELGRRRRYPRWAWLIALAALAGLVAAAIVSRPSAHNHPGAAGPTPTPTFTPDFDAVASAMAIDVAVAGHETWVLHFDRISLVDDRSAVRASAPYHPDVTDADPDQQLLVDPAAGVAWVVVAGATGGEVIEYDAFTLHEQRIVPIGEVTGAAVFGGRLYLASGRLLVAIAPGAEPRTVATSPTGVFYGVAGDRADDRLFVLDAGWPTTVWSLRPGGRLDAVVGTLTLGKGSLAVAAGRLWVGGYGPRGAVLERVLPGTPFRSRLADQLGPGALVVAAGERVVWVRDGAGGSGLWCIDAITGRTAQYWDLIGPVSSTSGVAVVATPGGPVHLHLSGCAG